MGKIGKPSSLRLRPYAVLISFFCGDVGCAIRGRAARRMAVSCLKAQLIRFGRAPTSRSSILSP